MAQAGVNGRERMSFMASIRVAPPVSGPFCGMETGVFM